MSEYAVCPHCHSPLSQNEWTKVVRCRDCAKWSPFDTEDGKRIGDCSEWTHLDGFSHATNEDGFCAWGERKSVADRIRELGVDV